MKIILNGDPLDLPASVTISELLVELQIDPRRVAVEHNLIVLKRGTFDTTIVTEGDQVEIVNFVGGGEPDSLSSVTKTRRARSHDASVRRT